jgi:hypothetical protein
LVVAPFNASFVESCASSIFVANNFSVELFLRDAFGTRVLGNIYALNEYTASMASLPLSPCELYQNGQQVMYAIQAAFTPNGNGAVSLSNLSYVGYNLDTCSSYIQVTNNVSLLSRISPLNCSSNLNGCPEQTHMQTNTTAGYSTCVAGAYDDPSLHTMYLMLVLFVVLVCLCLTCVLVLLASCIWYYCRRADNYSNVEIPDFENRPRPTLDGMTSRHIAWFDMARVG